MPLHHTINQALQRIHIEKHRDISIESQIDNDMVLKHDFALLSSVIENVVNNSIDAIKNKGSITIQDYQSNGNAHIIIDDTGRGMESDFINTKLFKPFSSNSDKGMSLGLGLYMCREIVLAHQGDINIKSTKDKGTTVIITLPLTK